MRIIFVRHGHPNYKLDRLTELGHLQAEAAAERVRNEGIERIYSSTCGRAIETAEHTADLIGIPREEIVRCNFMREISWKWRKGQPYYDHGEPQTYYDKLLAKGEPWAVADETFRLGAETMKEDWAACEPFSENAVTDYARSVADRGDVWLAHLGLRREGDRYRVTRKDPRTVAMFSHAGSSSALLAHVFGIPFPFVFRSLRPDYTAVTEVVFDGEEGEIAIPRFRIAVDSKHIKGITGATTVPGTTE